MRESWPHEKTFFFTLDLDPRHVTLDPRQKPTLLAACDHCLALQQAMYSVLKADLYVYIVFTWRHHSPKSKTKDPPKFLSSSGKEVAYLYLFTILQLNSLLRFETRAFWISGFCGCVTHGDDRVCWKIYSYLMILSLFRSWSIRKRVYVNTCIFSTDNQSPR